MAKNVIEELKQKIDKILQEQRLEVEDIRNQISAIKEKKAAKQEHMEIAMRECDINAYRSAKEELRIFEDSLEMYTARLDELNNKPCISVEVYEEECSRIMEYLEQASNDAGRNILKHIEQIKDIGEKFRQEVETGNTTLHRWQHEIYKDDASEMMADGRKVYPENLERKYKNYTVSRFVNILVNGGAYAQLKKGIKESD